MEAERAIEIVEGRSLGCFGVNKTKFQASRAKGSRGGLGIQGVANGPPIKVATGDGSSSALCNRAKHPAKGKVDGLWRRGQRKECE